MKKKKIIISILIVLFIFSAGFAAYFIYAENQNRQKTNDEQSYLDEVLAHINGMHARFSDNAEDHPYRVALYNELNIYIQSLAADAAANPNIKARYEFVLDDMHSSFISTYNDMIDEVAISAGQTLDEYISVVSQKFDELSFLYEQFTSVEVTGVASAKITLAAVSYSPPDTGMSLPVNAVLSAYAGLADKIDIFLELSDTYKDFDTGDFLYSLRDTINSYIDTLHNISLIIESDGIITEISDFRAFLDKINSMIDQYRNLPESEDIDTTVAKFDDFINSGKTWFADFYISQINAIADMPVVSIEDIENITHLVEYLNDLGDVLFSSGIFDPAADINDAVRLSQLSDKIDELASDIEDRVTEAIRLIEEEQKNNQQAPNNPPPASPVPPSNPATPPPATPAPAPGTPAPSTPPPNNPPPDNPPPDNPPPATPAPTPAPTPNPSPDPGSQEIPSLPNMEDLAAEVLRFTNIEREKEGLAPLTADNALLTASALVRANEIIVLWSHTRPDGRECFTAYVDDLGGSWRTLGENLAKGQRTPEAVVQAWMNSPGHRANIMNPSFTQLGVGAVNVNGYMYWAQMFCG